MASLSDVIGNAKNASSALSGAGASALTSLSQGDVGGAVSAISSAPGDFLAAFNAAGGVAMGDARGGMQARTDALQNWCWYCIPPAVDNVNSVELAGAQNQVSLPWYYVQKTNLPWRAFNFDPTQRNGRQVHYPASYSVADLSMDLFLDDTNKAMMWARAWQGQMMGTANPTQATGQGNWGLPAKYKKTLQFVLLNTKRKQVMNIKYINCTPGDFSALELVSGAAESLVLSLTFKVEDVDVQITNDVSLVDSLSGLAQGYAMSAISGAASSVLNKLGDIAGQIVS